MSKIVELFKSTDNSIEIKLDNGQEIRVVIDSPYNPKGIKVVTHSEYWNRDALEFVNFGYPED